MLTLGDFWSWALGLRFFLEPEDEEEEEEGWLPLDFARMCERWLSGVDEDGEEDSKGSDRDRFLSFFFSLSESSPFPTRLTFASFKRGGNTQLQRTPKRASRFTHLGIDFWASLRQTSLQKWLQFLVMRWYLFPWYSSANFSIKTRTSFATKSVFPTRIDFLNVKPGHFFGSTSKIPVLDDSCAPNAYSTPWTTKH